MTNEQLAETLGFGSIAEMQLFRDICIGYSANEFMTKQECLRIIENFGLYDKLSQLKNMTKIERIAYGLHELTGALMEAVEASDTKATNSIISSILKQTVELQECNFKELEHSTSLSK